jgi:hypothetical protein
MTMKHPTRRFTRFGQTTFSMRYDAKGLSDR